MFVYDKSLIDEEERLNRIFPSSFVMTDDISVIKSMQDYANPYSNSKDESYARKHLNNR